MFKSYQKENVYLIILLSAVLLFPLYHYFHLYFAVNSVLLGYLIWKYGFTITKPIKVLIFLMILYVFGRIVSGEIFIRDLYELARFTLLILVLGLNNFFEKIDTEFMLKLLAIYVLVDFGMSTFQFFNYDVDNIVYTISKLYSSVAHFGIAHRVNGLSSGPGQHGTIIGLLYVVFFIKFLVVKNMQKSYMYLAISILALVSIVFAQAKSAILALISMYFVLFIWILYVKNKTMLLKYISSAIGLLFVSVIIYVMFVDDFANTLQMVDKGIMTDSFVIRLNSYELIYNMAKENPMYWLFGYGKVYFGRFGTAMDSEVLYFLLVYGLLFSLVLLYYFIRYIQSFLQSSSSTEENSFGAVLVFSLITGIVMALPLSFFSHPLNLVLIGIFVVLVGNESSKLNRENI